MPEQKRSEMDMNGSCRWDRMSKGEKISAYLFAFCGLLQGIVLLGGPHWIMFFSVPGLVIFGQYTGLLIEEFPETNKSTQ